MNKLIQKLMRGEFKRSPEYDDTICPGTPVKVFTVETDKFLCKLWNSSNNNDFDKRDITVEIADKLLEDKNNLGGTVSQDFKEIMFEIIEK